MLDPASELAFRRLRDSILTGELEGGARLVESKLATQLGVSRTPVREALRRLAQSGLAEAIPRGGAVVRSVTVSDIISAYACRGALEGLAARLACQNRTRHDLIMFEECLQSAREALASNATERLLTTNSKFHEILVRAAKNQILDDLISRLSLYTAYYKRMILQAAERFAAAQQKYLAYVTNVVDEHEELVRLIQTQRDVKAEGLARRHLAHSAALMSDVLRFVQFDEARPASQDVVLAGASRQKART